MERCSFPPQAVSVADVQADLEGRGLAFHAWGNGPGDTYGWHDHPYHKTLVCLEGSIVFHTDGGDLPLTPSDVLDCPPAPTPFIRSTARSTVRRRTRPCWFP